VPLRLRKQRRAELAGGEGVEGAEAGGEFGGGQAALAVEAAEKIGGGFPFLGVAFHAAGDQVAVGTAPRPRLRHDVVQALDRRRGCGANSRSIGRARGRGWPFAASRLVFWTAVDIDAPHGEARDEAAECRANRTHESKTNQLAK